MRGSMNSKDKAILMLSWEYPPHIVGGLARHVHALSIELVKRNQQIHVITSKPFDSEDYEKQEGVHIHRVSPLNDQDPDFIAWIGGLNLAVIEKTLTIARHINFDAVHTHDWMTGPAAEFISKSLGIPLVATIHGTEFGRNKGIFTELQQFIYKKENELCHCAEEIIVCSEYMEKEVKRLVNVPSKKITVIPNGAMSAESDQPGINIEHIYPFISGKKLIFSVGRMVKEKGFETLIETAIILEKINPEVCFVIAGNGPLLDDYRERVRLHDLSDSVFFIGFVNEDIRQGLLERANIAVFASTYEPFGLAAAEAIAAGVPTVVAETGGMKALVKDFETGFYMQPGNEKSLADIIKWILENESMAAAVGQKGKHSVVEKFRWSQNAKSTDSLYRRSISNYCPKEGIK